MNPQELKRINQLVSLKEGVERKIQRLKDQRSKVFVSEPMDPDDYRATYPNAYGANDQVFVSDEDSAKEVKEAIVMILESDIIKINKELQELGVEW